jgi:hypothetical protein
LFRTLRRLRTDVVALHRVLDEPWPELVREHLTEPWSDFARAAAAALADIGRSLVSRERPSQGQAVWRAIENFTKATDDLRPEALARQLTADAIGRVFGTVFVLNQFRHDLEDLLERADDSADRSAYTSRPMM